MTSELEGYGPGYVRLWRGLTEHLPHFADNPQALVIYNWALLTRDHRTGRFIGDRRDISNQTGLSQWQIKRAIAWLVHGRGCPCAACLELGPEARPSYIELVRGASRGSPPVYYIRKDDSGRLKREKKKEATGQEELPLDDATPTPEEDEDDGEL